MYLLTFPKNTPLAKVGIATREGSDLEAQAEPGTSWAKSMPEEPASRVSPHRVVAPGLHRAGGSRVRSHLTVAADPDEHAALWCCDFLAGSVTDVCPLAPWFQGPAEHPLSRFHWTNTSRLIRSLFKHHSRCEPSTRKQHDESRHPETRKREAGHRRSAQRGGDWAPALMARTWCLSCRFFNLLERLQ